MAVDKLVDSTQLDANLLSIANAIRAKGGTTGSLAFPNGFVSAVNAIPTGGAGTLIEKNIVLNGTYAAEDDNADGYSEVTVNVPNTYAAGDEGKVVQSGALVSQTSQNVTENGTYDTTTKNSVTVNVPTGGSLPSSISGLDGGVFTPASDQQASVYNIAHSLGDLPKGFIIWTEDALAETTNTKRYVANVYISQMSLTSGSNTYVAGGSVYIQNTNGGYAHLNADVLAAALSGYLTATTFKYNNANVYYKAGLTYKWLAWR